MADIDEFANNILSYGAELDSDHPVSDEYEGCNKKQILIFL